MPNAVCRGRRHRRRGAGPLGGLFFACLIFWAVTAPLSRGAVLLPGEAGVDSLKVGRAGATISMVLLSAPADLVSMPVAGSTSLAVMLWFPSASGPSA